MMIRISSAVSLALALVSGHAAFAQDKPVATVDGVPLLESELDIRSRMNQLEQQAYQLRLRAIEDGITQKLLQKAAAEKNVTVEELLAQEVDAKIPEPSPEQVEGFYWGQRDKIRQPLEKVREQLARNLKSLKIQEARRDYARSLREKSSVMILLEPPRQSVEIGNAPRRGPATAPVTIVEFSDFQCPYCRRVQGTLQDVLAKYGDRVSLVYKDLPLQMHPEAVPAAQAARCAGEQGKFWEYHDALYAADSLGAQVYGEIAAKLGLDSDGFQTCLDSRRHHQAVLSDKEQAESLGINGTPGFLVNGIPLGGAQPFEAFATIIDSELKRAGGQ